MPTNKLLLNMTTTKPPTVATLVPMLPVAAVACVGQYTSPVQQLHYKIPELPNITTLPHTILHWKGNVKTAFSKRQYMYSKMLMRAVEAMDMERRTMTMA
eukprot:15351451-Ditylum_brightwellii.AAC.1